ncbi:MAG TPA: hypothetical protein VGC65_01755, partial [Bacteroidia bacterium]
MEQSDAIKISIPKPCHEDWNEMTANEKGAFCGKCCKAVLDFTTKTPDEIRSTLIEQSGKKICGRFMSDQLDEKPAALNFSIPLYLLPKNISYRKAFAIALFFAFGTSLFSCRTTDNQVVGEIAIVDSVEKGNNQLANNPAVFKITGDTIYSSPKEMLVGQVASERVCTPV